MNKKVNNEVINSMDRQTQITVRLSSDKKRIILLIFPFY